MSKIARKEIRYVHNWFKENKSLLEETNSVFSSVNTPVGEGYFKIENDYLKVLFSVGPWVLSMDTLTLDDMKVLMYGDFFSQTMNKKKLRLKKLFVE